MRVAWLKRFALPTLFFVWACSAVSAQTPQSNQRDLETTLTPGVTVWITDRTGREEKTRIVDVTGDVVTATTAEDTRRLRTADIVRVRARHSDSLINGALIGAGAGVASGLVVCRLMEPWEVCNDVGPLLQFGAVGAGIGIGVDALIRGRRTIYEAARGSTRLYVAPIVTPRRAALHVSVRF